MNAGQLLPALVAYAASLALSAGCGSGGNGFGEVGTYASDGGSFLASEDANGSGALDAHIEQNHVTVTFVTLSCSGPCADIVAVPTGGHAPYTFQWEDGSTNPGRHVCPTSSTSYDVKVTDTGTSGELARAAQTVQVPLMADVIACPDGGESDGGSGLCISNPSFEGMASLSAVPDAPPWADCAPAIANQQALLSASLSLTGQVWPSPAPTDGNTYLLMGTNGGVGFQAVSEPLCATLHAGTTYSLEVDLASPSNTDGGVSTRLAIPASLQIFGGSSSCSQGQLLWSSPTASPTWQTYCATFTPAQETTYLSLAVIAPQNPQNYFGEIYVDHIVPVVACR